jgi:hypothetical protein
MKAEWVTFKAADDIKLSGLYLAQNSPPEDRFVVLYAHGNGGHIGHRLDHAAALATFPVDVFMYDYRGYGKSSGVPTVPGVIQDGIAAWKYLTEERKVKPERIILYGFSLGCGVTGEVLKRVAGKCAGVILESGFSSVASQAYRRFFFLGTMALRADLSTVSGVQSFSGPLLVMHSRKDEVISFAEGQITFAASPAKNKTFFEMADYHHNDRVWSDPAYLATVRTFLASFGVVQP